MHVQHLWVRGQGGRPSKITTTAQLLLVDNSRPPRATALLGKQSNHKQHARYLCLTYTTSTLVHGSLGSLTPRTLPALSLVASMSLMTSNAVLFLTLPFTIRGSTAASWAISGSFESEAGKKRTKTHAQTTTREHWVTFRTKNRAPLLYLSQKSPHHIKPRVRRNRWHYTRKIRPACLTLAQRRRGRPRPMNTAVVTQTVKPASVLVLFQPQTIHTVRRTLPDRGDLSTASLKHPRTGKAESTQR